MNTIEIDSKRIRRPSDAYRIFEENGLHKGDEVRINTEGDSTLQIVTTLILMAIVLYLTKEKDQNQDFGNKILEDLFSNKDPERIEEEIEREYGVTVETRNNMKENQEKIPAVEHLKRIAEKGELKKTIPDPLQWQKEQREDRSLY